MKIKFSYKTKDEIPEAFRELFEEKEVTVAGGAKEKHWILQCDGAVDRERFKEFRDSATRLQSENTALKEKYEGIEDPDRARELLSMLKDVKDTSEAAKILKAGGIDPIIETRTRAMKEAHQKALDKLTGERDSYLQRLNDLEISQAAIAEATKLGLKPGAVLDLTMRAKTVFKLHEGKVVAFKPDGKTIEYGEDGVTSMSIPEWVKGLSATAPHLFEANSGGGASGGGAGGNTSNTPNPFLTENVTEQMKLYKTDPAKYKRLEEQARAERQKEKAK